MNLFELFIKIGVDDEASKKLENITSKVGNGLKTAAKIGTAAVTAAAAGITALTTASVKNYAEYEQLVGGVDTLFKKSSKKLQKYAADAYKTAGMSANDYMSTVTSFSASLLQSLGGDTEKAADYADRAIIDMADNANKMGTSMEMIQNAYQGFAKQNYTMLDNLKLGYGGTKEEMQRLLDDASKISGIEFDLSSFADITEAIHVMQDEMGIAGTTSQEAATTIEGSLKSMEGAWSNLITAISDPEQDLEKSLDTFVETVETFVEKNLMPIVGNALDGVAGLVEGIFPIIAEKLPGWVASILPQIVSSIILVTEALTKELNKTGPGTLIDVAVTAIVTLVNGLLKNLPMILQAAINIINALVNGIAENIDKLIPAVLLAITTIIETLTKPENVEKLTQSTSKLITGIVNGLLSPESNAQLLASGISIIANVILGIIASIPQVLESIGNLIGSIFDEFWNADWKGIGEGFINKILDGLKSAWNNVKKWWSGAWDFLTGKTDTYVPVSKKKDGSHASGLNYVPFDGYMAELHRGEMVLDANEAEGYRNGGENSGLTVIQNIYSEAKTAADLMSEALYQQEKAVYLGV